MATDVTSDKQIIFVEDVKTGASASESTMTKIAATTNKLTKEVYMRINFAAHGSYWSTVAPDLDVDYQQVVPYNSEIVRIRVYLKTAGASGTTEIDIKKKQDGGSWASIFSTRPLIPFSSGDGAVIHQAFLPTASTIFQSAGTTLMALSSTDIDANDILRLDFIDKQTQSAESIGVEILLALR